MRLDINLATRPYRDVRKFLMTWGTATALLALFTIALCWYALHSWRQSRNIRDQVSHVQSEIQKLDQDRTAAIALLNQPKNRDLASESAFLNGLIARRSFSWTRLFMELERIMPPRLHVVSIAPSLNKKNQIEIQMVVGGDSREQALQLVKQLEDSPSFRQPELRAETFGSLPGGDRVQFDISSLYVPQASLADEKNTDNEPHAENNSTAASSGDKSAGTSVAPIGKKQRAASKRASAGGIR